MNEQFVVRAAEFVGAYGVTGTAPANVDAETIAMARCELIKQSLGLFIRFCYQRDAAGFYCNLSGNTFMGYDQHSCGQPQSTHNEWCMRSLAVARTVVSIG